MKKVLKKQMMEFKSVCHKAKVKIIKFSELEVIKDEKKRSFVKVAALVSMPMMVLMTLNMVYPALTLGAVFFVIFELAEEIQEESVEPVVKKPAKSSKKEKKELE